MNRIDILKHADPASKIVEFLDPVSQYRLMTASKDVMRDLQDVRSAKIKKNVMRLITGDEDAGDDWYMVVDDDDTIPGAFHVRLVWNGEGYEHDDRNTMIRKICDRGGVHVLFDSDEGGPDYTDEDYKFPNAPMIDDDLEEYLEFVVARFAFPGTERMPYASFNYWGEQVHMFMPGAYNPLQDPDLNDEDVLFHGTLYELADVLPRYPDSMWWACENEPLVDIHVMGNPLLTMINCELNLVHRDCGLTDPAVRDAYELDVGIHMVSAMYGEAAADWVDDNDGVHVDQPFPFAPVGEFAGDASSPEACEALSRLLCEACVAAREFVPVQDRPWLVLTATVPTRRRWFRSYDEAMGWIPHRPVPDHADTVVVDVVTYIGTEGQTLTVDEAKVIYIE